MEKVLLIGSLLCLHYPVGLYKDTGRRLKNMVTSDKDLDYKLQNGIPLEYGIKFKHGLGNETNPVYKFDGATIAFFGSLALALFSLEKLIDVDWYILLIINIALFLFLAPILAFLTTPTMKINSQSQLKIKTYIFTTTGILLYGLASI